MPASSARVPSPKARAAVSRPIGPNFTSIEVAGDFDAVAETWAEIAAASAASPYQSLAFARGWAETIGSSGGVAPMIVIARDAAGTATALLPLGRFGLGPLRLATFLGGRFANYQMGLFRAGLDWRRDEVEALLRAAARRARIDAFLFINQPDAWRGAMNPMAALARQPSPSAAYASALPAAHAQWMERYSASTRKKIRKKLKKLEAIGPVSHLRATGSEEARAVLRAFLAQKSARADAAGQRSEFEFSPAVAFLERLADSTTEAPHPTMELHALRAGDRIVATFGGLADRSRLSGLILSFDLAPEIAAASPGEYLVTEIARDAIARGLAEFDLGTGEARYKNVACEMTEPLFDGAFAVTRRGRLAASAFLLARAAKRLVKRSPRLYALALRARRRFG